MTPRLPQFEEKLFLPLRMDLSRMGVADWAFALNLVTLDDFIHAVCLSALGEPADQAQICAARALGSAGRAQFVRTLMQSPELRDRHGKRAMRGLPLEAFIRQTYRDVLGRSPDSGGMQTYLRMGRKWRGRNRVVAAILGSAEGRDAEGGRLGRMRVLRQMVWRSRVYHLPLLGRLIEALDQHVFRLQRMELFLAAQLATPAQLAQAGELLRQVAGCLPRLRPSTDEVEVDDLPPGATINEVDNWTFQTAVVHARRRELGGQPS